MNIKIGDRSAFSSGRIATWIAIIGAIAGFAIAIAAIIITTGPDAIWITAIMLLVFGGMFYLFYRLFFKPMLNARRLMKVGIPGKAKILEVKDTGITINNSPQVKLILEVKNSFGQKYTAQCRMLVSRINPWAYQPGMELAVRIDPDNEQNIIIDNSGGGQFTNAQSSDTAALATTLQNLQSEQEPIRISGRPARAIVKEYKWLGLYVNGNNQFAELLLEVLPENGPSFSATTKGVITEASVPKFQAGKEIMVRYDYYDNSKVVIDHSL